MTDKLADALKVCVEQLERTHHLIKGPDNSGAINTGREALTEYEAAKAATHGTIYVRFDEEGHTGTFCDVNDGGIPYVPAALRQGVTIPREVDPEIIAWLKMISVSTFILQTHRFDSNELAKKTLALFDQHARGV